LSVPLLCIDLTSSREETTAESPSKGKERQKDSSAVTLPTDSSTPDLKSDALAAEAKGHDAESVVYFNAVPVTTANPGETSTQEEEDEIAAFLPMLQDYLRREPLSTT